MDSQALYRTSAVVFAEETSVSRKTETIRRRFVESVFVEKQNVKMTLQEIGNAVDEVLHIFLTDNEIEDIVRDDNSFVRESCNGKDNQKYSLKLERYNHLKAKSENNIERVINRYVGGDNNLNDTSDSILQLLNRYLYALMNSNILAYRQVLNPSTNKCNDKCENSDLTTNVFVNFTNQEREQINRFLSWKDSAKDKELYKLVSCCIEYAIAINNSKENALVESFKNKVFYLDNALIYRAIGINGEQRKKRTLSFIRKCRESGQSLCVSKYSYNEFIHTIDYHLKMLNRTTPFGKINPQIFHRYASGEGFFQFYHSWRGNRTTYSFEIFKNYIIGEYNSLLKMYDIKEDYAVPFNEDEDIPALDRYSKEIASVKNGRGHQNLHENDARNMYWIECKRNGIDGRMTDTKYYFVTSDLKLQFWDYSHSHNQPITLLPNQWMALLLKYYSRTNDDYKSFVSFLNLPNDDQGLDPEELQDILAGISQTTEDFKKQALIVETFLETDWQKQRKQGTVRMQAKDYAKDKLEEQFTQQILEKEKKHGLEISSLQESNRIQIESIKEVFRQQFELAEIRSKQDKLSMICQQMQDVLQQKSNIEIQVEQYIKNFKIIIATIGTILLLVWLCAIIYFGIKTSWFISAIIAAIGMIALISYCVIYEKRISVEKTISNVRKMKEKEYKIRFSYSDDRLKELDEMKKNLKSELNNKD